MNPRCVWPFALMLGVGVVVFGLSYSSAQRPMVEMGSPAYYGRFVVAFADADRVLVLDSTTGHIYAYREKDFKPATDLPRVDGGFRPELRIKDKDGRFGGGKDKMIFKDKVPSRDKDKGFLKDKE